MKHRVVELSEELALSFLQTGTELRETIHEDQSWAFNAAKQACHRPSRLSPPATPPCWPPWILAVSTSLDCTPFCSPPYLCTLHVLHLLRHSNPTHLSGQDLGPPAPGNLPGTIPSSCASIKALLQPVYLWPTCPLPPGNGRLLPGRPES